MERFQEIIDTLSDDNLSYLLAQLCESIEHKQENLVPLNRLESIAEEYDFDEDDLELFENISRHILVESTAKRSFDNGKLILK